MTERPPPGTTLTAFGIFHLAESYRLAGDAVGRDGAANRFSENPRRFLYLQAIENYLRAYLWQTMSPKQLAEFRHDLSAMLDFCVGLKPSKDAVRFVRASSLERDFIRTRYDYDVRYDGGVWPPPHQPNASMALLASVAAELGELVRVAVLPTP